MATGDTDETGTEDPADQRKVLMYVGIGVVTIFFLIYDVINWINSGGVFSIFSAMKAVWGGAGAVDVDASGLFILFIAILWFFVVVICMRFKINVGGQIKMTMIGFAILVGSIVLNGTLGEYIVASLLHSHGYMHCIVRDHSEGHGKSRVWLQNYVHWASDCPPAQPTSS